MPIQKFKVGNGEYVCARYAIEVPVIIQRHKFIVRALALDTLGGINLVIGTPALQEIDACLEFKANRLRFRHSTFPVRLTRPITLKPKHVIMVSVTARLPAVLRDATLFMKTTKYMAQFTSAHMLLQFRKGYASLILTNPTDKDVILNDTNIFGFVDVRYLTQSYMHIVAASQDQARTTLLYWSAQTSASSDPPIRADTTADKINTNNTQMTRAQLYDVKRQQYPFLDPSDSRLKMHDKEIIDRDIVFKHSPLDPDQQQKVKQLLLKYKEALSLHSEIGNSNLTIDFDLTDSTPFYIRPFTVSEAEKPIIDRELNKLVQMGVLKEHHSAYSSPVMLIRKKGTQDMRLVTDFRHLNTKIIKRNLPFPLIRETMHTIGTAQPTVLSVLDLRQAYHCLNLSQRCQNYCGITSYFGGKSYKYLKLPMGLSVSPCAFQVHINNILEKAQAKKFCIGIMDDLILFSKSIKEHHQHLEIILKALTDNGLKISPNKAKLFRTKVVYMGHEIVVNTSQQGIRPLRDRTEAIRKLPIPKTKRQLKGFIGKVTYLSMYLPKLQILLQPLHKISGKNADFVWTTEHQTAYDSILKLLVKPPLLTLPRSTGLFRLYVDTSKIGVGASLWQIQNGQECLLAYFSRALPKAAAHYGITELELTGLTVAVTAFKHLLKSTAFEVYTDHASIPQIMKSKVEPSTNRIKRLLERLSEYAIKIGFRKGSTMVIADYLSRNPVCSEQTSGDELAFPMLTRHRASKEGISVPSLKETLASQTIKQVYKQPVAPATQPVAPAAQPVAPAAQPVAPAAQLVAPEAQPIAPAAQPVAPATQPVAVPPAAPQPAVQPVALPAAPPAALTGIPPSIYDSEDDVQETHTSPPDSLLRQPVPLKIKADEIMTKHLPKQSEIDRLLKKLDKTCLQYMHLPYNKRELAKLQAQCPNYKDIYAYITEGLLQSPKIAAKCIMAQSELFVIIDTVLLRLPSKDSDQLRVVIPQSIVHEIIFIYHDSLLACHQCIARVTATIK